MERSLVVFKPDVIKRGLVGEILARFEKAGLKMVGMKMIAPDEAHFHTHYEDIGKMISRYDEKIFKKTLIQVSDGPVIATVLEGVDAIAHIRKMTGATNPQEAAPGTIRGDFTHGSRAYANDNDLTLPNLLHASGDLAEAQMEIALWFKPEELYEYDIAQGAVVYGKSVA